MNNRVGFLGIAALGMVMGLSACGQINKEEHVFTVDSKDRVCSSTGETTHCGFEVYGTEGEVFTNQDDLINGKFDSATFQAKLKVGKTYRVKTTGWRIPWASMKPNIYEMEEVATAETEGSGAMDQATNRKQEALRALTGDQ